MCSGNIRGNTYPGETHIRDCNTGNAGSSGNTGVVLVAVVMLVACSGSSGIAGSSVVMPVSRYISSPRIFIRGGSSNYPPG